MSGKKEPSIQDLFNKAAKKQATQGPTPTISGSGTIAGSQVATGSQIKEAGTKGTYGERQKVFSAPSKEALSMEKRRLEIQVAKETAQLEKEAALDVVPGTLNATIKGEVKDDDKFVEIVKEGERVEANLAEASKKNTDFFDGNGFNLLAPAYKLYDLFAEEKDKLGRGKEYDVAKAEKAQYLEKIRPYTETHNKFLKAEKERIEAEEKELQIQIEGISGKKAGEAMGVMSGMTINPLTLDSTDPAIPELLKKQNLKRSTRILLDQAQSKLNDFTTGETSIWNGIGNTGRDLATVGLSSLTTDLEVLSVVNKAEKDRTPEEQELLTAYARKSEVEKLDLFQDEFWYKAAEGTGHSLVFMESMLLTRGAGGAARQATQKGFQGALKKTLSETIKGSFKRKLGVALTQRAIPASVGIGTQTLLSPTTYASMVKEKLGDVSMVKDIDGTERVVVNDAAFDAFQKEEYLQKNQLKFELDKLKAKGNLTPREQEDIKILEGQIEYLDSQYEQLRPKSWFESFAYGATETAKEFVAEKYVGRLGDKLGASKFVKKGLSKLPFAKTRKFLNEQITSGQDLINKSFLGTLSSKAMYHTGANKIYNGLPGEIMEEIAVQATPTLRFENFGQEYLNQLAELTEPAFYADVVGQTLLMSGGTTVAGSAGNIVNYKKRKEFYNDRKEIREAYKSIDRAITDEDLAETILMASAGTSFSQLDYNYKIAKLREENKHEEANAIEQKKFMTMAVKAIETNTLDEFEKALSKLSSNTKAQFSTETAINIGLAKTKIEEIKKTYAQYSNRSNVGKILDLATQKIALKESVQNLDKELDTQRALANEELELLMPDTSSEYLSPILLDIDALLDETNEDPTVQSEVNRYLDLIDKTASPAIKTYVSLLEARDNTQAARRMVMREYNEQVSPEFEVSAQRVKSVQRQIADTVNFIEKNNMSEVAPLDSTGRIVWTDSFVEDVFKKVDTKGLSKAKVEQLKQGYKNIVKSQAQLRNSGASTRIANLYDQALIEAKKQPITPEPISSNEVTDATQETDTQVQYEKELSAIKEGLLDPIITQSPEIDEDYLFQVPAFANALKQSQKEGEVVTISDVKNITGITSDVLAQKIMGSINANLKATKPTDLAQEEVVQEAQEQVAEVIVNLQNQVENIINPVQEFPDYLQIEEDSLDLDPTSLKPLGVESLTPEQIKALGVFAKDAFKQVKDYSGVEPNFKDFVHYFIRFAGKEKAEKSFEAYRLGWEVAGLPSANYTEVYDEIFEPLKDTFLASQAHIDAIFSNTPTSLATVTEGIEDAKEQNEIVEKAQVETITFNEENVPVKSENDRRVSGEALRLGFNAIKYEEQEILDDKGNKTGRFKRVPVLTDTLNLQDSVIDFRSLLDPEKNNAGDTLNVAVVPEAEWSTIPVYVGRDSEQKPVIKTFAEIFSEKLVENPNFRETQEFINIVPVVAYDSSNRPVAHIHETSWYNIWNVADPSKRDGVIDPSSVSMAHLQAIEEAKQSVSDFRSAIVKKGVSKITILEKKEGPFYTIEDRKDEQGNVVDFVSLNETNPQAVVAVQGNQGVLEVGDKLPFENENRTIINKDQVFQKGKGGHIWNLRRIGTSPEGKELWRAFKSMNAKNTKEPARIPEEELETVRWAWSAYSFFDTQVFEVGGAIIQQNREKYVAGTSYDMDEVKAREVIQAIKDNTGYNLMRFEDADAFFSLYFHPKIGRQRQHYAQSIYGTVTGTEFYHNVSRGALNKNPNMVKIVAGEVIPLDQKYNDYLKSKYYTGVLSFNIGTAEEPNYVTSIQPTITFEYDKEVKEETPVTVVEERKLATEVEVTQLKQTTSSAAQLIAEAKKLQQDLGFKPQSTSLALPSTMKGVDALKDIFSLTPGLDIAQEAHLLNFIYNYINTAIGIKKDSKANKKEVITAITNSYKDIVLPSKQKIDTLKTQLEALKDSDFSTELADTLEDLGFMSRVLTNIENNWNVPNIKATLEAQGVPYSGQKGIIEKAMEEVEKTSDIKEKQLQNELEDKEDAEEHSEEGGEALKVKSFEDNASLTENGKNKTSYRLRRFMSGILRVDSEGNPIKGFLGLPEYINYNEAYDTLFQLLGSGVYIESDFAIMKAKILEMKKAQPWVVELMERFDKADAQLRNEFVVNYRKHAVSMKFTMYSSTKDGSKLKVYDTNANEVSRVIVKEWENNFKMTPLVNTVEGKYLINKEKAKELLDQYNSWERQGHLQPDSVVKGWLANFGLKFSEGYWDELKNTGFSYGGETIPYNRSFEGNTTPIGLLAKYLENVEKQKDLNFEENEKAHPFKDMNAVIKALSKGESKYSGKILSKSFRDAKKSISGLTQPTHATDRIDDLIRAISSGNTELIDTLKSISITSSSTLLELLQNDPDFYKKLEINHLGLTSIKEYAKENFNSAAITDLNNLDHDLAKLGMFQDTQQGTVGTEVGGFRLRMARMFLPTMSDKTQMLTMATGVFDFMSQDSIAFMKKEGGVVFTPDLRELLYQKLILPEMKRISKFHKEVKSTDIKDYDNAAQVFNFFPALNMLTDTNGDRIIKHLVEQDVETVEKAYKDQLIDVVEATMHALVEEKKTKLAPFVNRDVTGKVDKIKFFDTKYLSKGKGNLEENFETAVYDFVLNSVLTNADMFTLLAGDPALYSQDKLFKGQESPNSVIDDNFYSTFAEKHGVNIGKRLALLIAPGRVLAQSNAADAQYLQVFLKDSVDITANADYLITLFAGKEALNEPLFENAPQTVAEALTEYKASENSTRKNVIRTALKNKFADIDKLGDYFDIESTDAQEYTTINEHLKVLFLDGKLPEEDYNQLLTKVAEGQILSKEELGQVLQPIKPVYTGQIFEKNDKGEIKGDVARTVYIKSSSFPLIPQLVAGTNLENLKDSLEALEKKHGKTVRASYETANKVGSKISSVTVNPVNLNTEEVLEKSMLVLDRKNFRIQQDVPFKSDSKKEDTVAMGTQIFKLLFGDGVIDVQEKVFEYEGAMYNGRELYEKYKDNFEILINLKKQDLFNELGLNEIGVPISEEKTMNKLQTLLQKEAESRDYPLQDIRSLGIETLYDKTGSVYYDFKTPLWLTTNSDRFESLLNAIVTKRIMAHKMPGNAFVAGSENGFSFKKDLKGINQSRVIYFDNFNGKELEAAQLNEDGSLKKAQVLVPSKFKNKEGKLIDLFATNDEGQPIYVEKRENGTWKLKEGVISSELFNLFSFRTPTSSHVSASSIEVVGILPPEVGDLIITPKNFTKQMGQDFDVDKLSTYQLHHVVDFKTGKVEPLTEKHKERGLRKISMFLEELDFQKESMNRKMVFADVLEILTVFEEKEDINLGELLGPDLMEELIEEQEDKYAKVESTFNKKLAENAFIKMHLSVFNSSSPVVQEKINKVLSMEFAKSQANKIQELIEIGKKEAVNYEMIQAGLTPEEIKEVTPMIQTSFTILSDEYQKSKMALGSAGKMAIGIYSNYVTFHALTQQVNNKLSLNEKEVTIGQYTSSGLIGKKDTLDGKRSIAEAFAERQNTATDNEKEQILGRVNVNSTTIGVDSLLTLLGFDQDEKGNSISYMLLSQPIIKDYVEMMNASKGITAPFQKNVEESTLTNLVAKYGKGEYNFDSNERTIFNEKGIVEGSELTGEALTQGITKNGKEAKVQMAALQTFLDLKKYAENIAKVQSVLFTDNLGKSIVESNVKYEALKTFSENKLINNVDQLIGEFAPVEGGKPEGNGYVLVGDYYVKPTTPQGQIAVQGMTTAQTLWSDFFPYNSPGLQNIISEVLKISEVKTDSKFQTIEKTLEVIKEAKKYIYSWKGLGLYTEPTMEERKRLFISNGTNTSLAQYLSQNSKDNALVNNKLLNRFTYEVEFDGRPSLIKYNNTISDNLEEKYLYNSLAELMLEDKPLPDFNGNKFSTRQLAQELVSYAYLEGGVQQAIQFIKYIPVEYLSEVGINTTDGFLSAATVLQRINVKRDPLIFDKLLGTPGKEVETSPFITQYYQHNPDQVKNIALNDKSIADLSSDKSSFTLNQDSSPKFLSVKQKTNSKLKQDKFTLYKHVGYNKYVKIDVLGIHGMNEYDALNKEANSIITKIDTVIGEGERVPLDPNTFLTPNVETIIQPTGELIQDNSNGLDTLKRIANTSTSNRYKALAEALLPFASVNTQVKVEPTTTGLGAKVSGFYKNSTITIDSTVPAQEKERVFMHEMVHAITLNKIRPYYSQDADGFYTIVSPTAPTYVKELDTVWKEYIKNTDPVLIERAKKKTIDLRNKRPALFSTEELEIGYPAIDIFEFFAVALESETFQKHLGSIPMDKSNLMDKFIDIIRTVLSEVGVSIEKGSLAEKSLSSIFNFIENEAEVEKQKAIFASINANISAEELAIMDRALAEEQERVSQLPPEDLDPTEDSTEAPDETLMPASEELLSEVGLTQEQWSSLSETEKTKIKDCK